MKFLVMITAAFLILGSYAAAAAQTAYYMLLLDASVSNPMAVNREYADRIARDVVTRIGEVQMADIVSITTLGEYDVTRNPVYDAEVNKYFPPAAALNAIREKISSFPNEVATTLGGAQKATNILGALSLASTRISCSDSSVTVIVLTDGQENGQEFTQAPKGKFAGCARFVMIGVVGPNPNETEVLVSTWKDWCSTAGFKRCEISN